MMMKTFAVTLLALSVATALPLTSRTVGARSLDDTAGDDTTGSVKVHGHWTIEVREPDGTLVEHREFENALQGAGPKILASILARKYRPGYWYVALSGPQGGPCSIGNTTQVECLIPEPVVGQNNTQVSSTLIVSAPTTGPNAARLVLSGRVTASGVTPNATLQITGVRTNQDACDVYSPGTCSQPGTSNGTFSSTTIAPLSVVSGQVIQVTVVLSFQ